MMLCHQQRDRLLAVALAFLAGYVDALGYLTLGGFFVSFMSGNSTRLGVDVPHAWRESLQAAGLIAAFVVGVMIGTAATRLARGKRGFIALSCVTVLLVIAAAAQDLHLVTVAAVSMAAAMGAENAVFQRDGEVSIGVTYMTGTLVKLGQNLVAALRGEERFGWVSYLLLWLGLVAGAASGATLYPWMHLDGLWLAVALSAALTVIALRTRTAH